MENNKSVFTEGVVLTKTMEVVIYKKIEDHPLYAKLLSEFHPTKNGELKLSDFKPMSNKKVFWKCFKTIHNDHEWEALISGRFLGQGCSCCAGRTVVLSNCLMTTHPELCEQWDYVKNGELTPFMVISGSGKMVHWKCDVAEDHEWEDTINHRTRGRNCSCCRGLKVVLSNCFATTHIELAKQFHPTKNGNLTPYDFVAGTHTVVWWHCTNTDATDHDWPASVNSRTNISKSNGCSCCAGFTIVLSNCIETTHPDDAQKWHPTKNGSITPRNVTHGSNKKAWWQCSECNHEWYCRINDKTNGSDCPKCNESRGEKAICYFLDKSFINYEQEKEFDECKYKQNLPFDFYLPNYNILIEYDGIQHFQQIEYWKGEQGFKQIKLRDSIKTAFAKDNNIPLLRIPYTEFDNIETILTSFLALEKLLI